MEAPISASQGAMRSLPGKLESLLSDPEKGLHKGEKNKIRALKVDLEELIAKYLMEPSEVEDPALTASSWMKEARELSYDIHDFVDDLAGVDAHAKIQQAPRSKISRFKEKRNRHQEITDQISSFRTRVKEAIQQHKDHLCNLRKWPSSSAAALDGRLLPPPPAPLEGGPRLVGMGSSIEELSGWLAKDGKPERRVASIVGVGGVGKTTLANELYRKLGGQFQCRAFVRTTQKPDHRRLLTSILSQVRPHQPVDAWGVPNLVEKIKKYLQNKTYFIIIDDLWSPSTWDIVSRALPKGDYCTRILTTTEVEVVARICCAGNSKYIFKKKQLNNDESKELFSNIISVHQSGQCPKNHSEVHEEIIKKIGGLPLAIIIMAGLLARQPDRIGQWNYMMSLPNSYLIQNANLEMMRHILNLSYNSIPHYLKACMLYLSLYAEDSIILKDDLVKQWISEGFICAMEGNDKEKVARSYFDELVSRGMIQPADIDSSDEVLSCTVHYMVLNLIRYISIEENFITAIDHSQTATRIADKVRRLALHFGSEEEAKPPTSMRLSQVRSLAFFGSVRCMPSVMQFRFLRVLNLKLWANPDETSYCNLSGISELFRLRYLRIDAYHVNVELPEHMQWLKDLVVLQIEAKVTTVPSDIIDMPDLLHLSLPSEAHLPTGFSNMISLRSLGYFDLSSNLEENVLDLGKLTNLEDLHLTCSTVQREDNLKRNMECLGLILEKLSNLKCVTLVPAVSSHANTDDDTGASSINISCNVLSNLSPSLTYLQRFDLFPQFCIFLNLPKWFGELHQLCILKVAVREISTEDIRILKALPALTALSLFVWSVPEGLIFIEEGGFPALRYFKFTCAAPCLAFAEGAMSDVQRLKLGFNANRLEQYNPADSGFKHLSALKEISVEIGGAAADKLDLTTLESALLTAFKKHRSRTLIINLQRVHWIYHGDREMSSTSLQKRNYQTLPVKGVITDEQHGRKDKQVNSRTSMSLESILHPQNPDQVRDRSTTSQQGKHRILKKQEGDVEEESDEGHEIQKKRTAESISIQVDFGTSAASESSLYLQNQDASLGPMRPLVAKLDKMLLDPTLGCTSESIKNLLKDVKELSSYLDQLSEVEDPPLMAKCWMNEARDLSNEMEDYFDSLLCVQPVGLSLVDKDMEEHKKIAAKVSEFNTYVQDAIERHNVSVQPDSGPSSNLRHRFVTLGPMLPMSFEDIVIDGRTNEFIESLTNDDDQQLKVVSVLGSACIGKTTLARVLYTKLGKRYHCRAFIRVSKKPDMKRIFHDMFSQLQQQQPPQHYMEIDLIHKIKKYLQYKRYLIIIDDIWTASVWGTINRALPNSSPRSRIVTSTQIKDVALACCCYQSEHVFEMKPLDDHHSRKLFFNSLFGSENCCPEQFKEVLNEIVELCGGLPLATISIASLLANQPVMTEDLLKHIHDTLSSCFLASSTSERTRQALNLSFNNLPYYLKTCLMYLSMYPEGYTFCTNDLVNKWMAEGFIDTTEGQDMKKVAESYLHQLIGRRFIQPIRINSNNELLSCAVHVAVYDLIARESSEENFIVAIDCSQKNVAVSRMARRLSLLCDDARYAKTLEITESKIRSLTFFGILECMPCITEFKLLSVLNLQLSNHVCEDNPVDLSGISELLLLRYLKIGSGIYIKLPIDGLQCLETLDITDAIVIRSSRGIILPHLLHLSLPFERSLLRWIGIQGEAGRLNCLEDLHLANSLTDDSDPEKNIEALGSLIAGHGILRTVVVADGSTVKNAVARGAVKVITSRPSKEEITSGAPLLQRFECSPAGGMAFYRIPKWVKTLDNLCILKITVKMLEMHCVGILRGLRALAALSLYVRRETSERIIFDKVGFSALNYFKLRFMTGIAWIKFEKDAMPNLLKLKLVFTAIPRMDLHPYFVWTHAGRHEQYKRGNALIIIEHMPGLREVSAKFGGAAADVEYIKNKRIGISNDPGNPEINMQWVDGQSTRQKLQTDEILEEDPADETVDIAAAGRSPESLHEFTLDELISATSNFSSTHFIGDPDYKTKQRNRNNAFCYPDFYKGSFQGKGNLRTGLAPQHVIVRCLSNNSEWLLMDKAELEHLARVRDPRLVRLLGFCDYYNHRMLVYEDMPGKTLEHRLLQYHSFPWLMRLKIAVEAAKALAFLHEADKPMVHGDFKASNILLDLPWRSTAVELFGFRLAKENARDKTAESDVYNFGVVVLQLLTGRPFVVENRLGPDDLVKWSRPYLRHEDKLHHIMDKRLDGQYSLSAAWRTATTACRCLESEPQDRPRMRDVVDALEPLLSDHGNDGSTWRSIAERQSRETKVSQ